MLAVPTWGVRATRAWQEGDVPAAKEGFRKILSSSVWALPLPWSLQVIATGHPGAAGITWWDLSRETHVPNGIPWFTLEGWIPQGKSLFPPLYKLPALGFAGCSASTAELRLRSGSCVCSARRCRGWRRSQAHAAFGKIRVIAQNGGEKCLRRSRCFSSAFGNGKFLFQEDRRRQNTLEIFLFVKWGFDFSGLQNVF